MSPGFVLFAAFGIGVAAGLRSMTAPALVAWAVYLDWINLAGSPLAFMGSGWALVIFSVLAVGEFVADKLPGTPARTATVPLLVRLVMALLSGACLAIAGGVSLWMAALAAAVGAIAGAFGGYQARAILVRALHVPDFVIAVPEDLVTIGLALFVVSRF